MTHHTIDRVKKSDTRATLLVEWNLDAVPGWNDNPEDLRKLVEKYLLDIIPHYKPEIQVVRWDR